MPSEISKSIQFLCDDKGLDYEIVIEALQTALGAAYRKDFGNRQQNIQVIFDPETGDMKVWDEKEVVEDVAEDVLEKAQEDLAERREAARLKGRELSEEEVDDLVRFNPKTQMMISEAKEHDKKAKLGDILKIDLEVGGDFGRMAAQTAKQVIIQKIREAERNTVFEDLKGQEGQVIHGFVQRRDRNGGYIIDLGKVTGILPQSEMVRREHYKLGARMKFYLSSVEMGQRGPQIVLSRADKRMVETTFEQEIPEIESGEVIIKGIARDAGNRSKVAVFTEDDSIDPIGSCIGQRGSRITTIIDELGGEKVDIIEWNEDSAGYIKSALSPAKVDMVELDEEAKTAIAYVAEDQFSLAIGRDGQNVRLATELTSWEITVKNAGGDAASEEGGEVTGDEAIDSSGEESKEIEAVEAVESEEKTTESPEENVEEIAEEASEEVVEKSVTEEVKEEKEA